MAEPGTCWATYPAKPWVSTQCLRSLGAKLQGAFPGPFIPANHPHTSILLCLSYGPSQSHCVTPPVTLVCLKDYVRPHSGGWQSGVHRSVPTVLPEPLPLPFCRGSGYSVHIQGSLCHDTDPTGVSGPGFGLCSHPQGFPTLPPPEAAPTAPENKVKEVPE